jgi:hypothetical protein
MINYPDPRLMSPFGNIMEGIQTGLAIRGQRKEAPQPSDAIIADPGEYQQTDPSIVLEPIQQDLMKLDTIEKNIRKLGVKDPDDKAVLQNYVKGGSFKSPIISALAESGIKSEDLSRIFTNVKNNSPDASGDLAALVTASKNNPKVIGAINAIGMEYQQAESQNKKQRAQVLVKTLQNIDQYHDNPKAFQGKSGITSDQTLKVVNKEKDYIKELAATDPEAFKQYGEARLAKTRSGGGSLKNFVVQAKDPKTNKATRVPYAAEDVTGWRNVPGADPSTAMGLGNENFTTTVVGQANLDEKLNPAPPKPIKKGQKADEAVFQKYKAYFKYTLKDDQKATDAAIQQMGKDGWK